MIVFFQLSFFNVSSKDKLSFSLMYKAGLICVLLFFPWPWYKSLQAGCQDKGNGLELISPDICWQFHQTQLHIKKNLITGGVFPFDIGFELHDRFPPDIWDWYWYWLQIFTKHLLSFTLFLSTLIYIH